jgi:type IV secretion system protein VirB5
MMKKSFIFGAFVAISVSFNASAGGIPVFDGVANTTALQQWIEKLQQWQQTVTHYQKQIDVANDQLNTLKGIKGHIKNFNINALINDINAIDNLMPNYDSIVNGNWNRQAEVLSKKLGIDERCTDRDKKLNNICKSENMNLASNYIATEKVNQQVNVITKKIRELAIKVASSQDIKTTTDINNQIALYNGQLETLDRKLSITQKQYELNRNLIDTQREIALEMKNLQPTTDFFQQLQNEFNRKKSRKSNQF